MIPKLAWEVVRPVINGLLGVIPDSPLSIPGVQELGWRLDALNHLIPLVDPVKPLVLAVLILFPPLAALRVTLFVYHQFWGSD